MTYKSLEDEISCTQTHQLEEPSCTQTQQSSKNTEDCCVIIFVLVICLFFGTLFVIIINSVPPRTKFSIVEASIANFNLTSNNTLYYNLEVTITAKNFGSDIESYDEVTAIAYYNGDQLASVKMASFKLSGKNIVRLQPLVFEGTNVMIFEPQQLVKYNKETQSEIYNLDLDIALYFRIHIHCSNVRVPLISNGKVAHPFNVTTCAYVQG